VEGKEEQLHTTPWNAERQSTTMVTLEEKLYGASTDHFVRFGQFSIDAPDRLELKLCPEASSVLKSKFP
jgi:hypothetical protein